MKFTVLMWTDPEQTKAMTTSDFEQVMAKHDTLRAELTKSGELAGGAGLAYPEETRTLRWRDGNVSTAIGPRFDAEEHISAYYELECADLDRALAIAERVLDFHVTAAEVRRVHDTADPAGT
jgi:hypothetical protein